MKVITNTIATMECIRRFIFAFLLMMWGVNGSAFDFESISYDVLSEDDKTVCVARQTATDQIVGDVVIPSQVKYGGIVYTVTEINGWAFGSCSKMTSITIPATVQYIGYSAFAGCYGLKAVNVEDIAAWCSVEQEGGMECNPLSLAHCLFLKGKEIKELVIPEGVTAIGNGAFHDASGLTSVVIPSTVTQIGSEAFAGCSEIKKLSMASGVKVIGGRAFSGCRNLTEVTVPEGTEQLGYGAFYGCGNLTDIHLPQSLLSIGDYAFEGCNSLMTIVIPDQVTELGGYAFYECENLTSVKLSDNITEIGDWTFTRCYQLKDINIPKNNLQRIGDNAFLACSNIEELTLPSTLTEIVQSAFVGCTGLRNITVEEGNLSYLTEDGVLFNYEKTKLMLFPAQCDKISYEIPVTVSAIAPGAFSGCKLKSLTLPSMLTEIGDSWLGGLAQLESIVIPPSVTIIGLGALSGCSSLKELYVPDNVRSIDRSAFSNCTSLVRVHLPEGLTRIEGWIFDGCTSLSEVNVPEGVNYIGIAAFRDCSSLPAFHIPKGVTTIDDGAFVGCQTLTELTIPDKVENVGWSTFENCSGLEKVTIGRAVKALEGGTFYGCDNIREVWSYIEEPFDVIDYEYAHDDVVLVGRCFPEAVTREATLYIPNGTKEKYLAKSGWRDFVNIRDVIQVGTKPVDNIAYRPFVEEDKVWKVGSIPTDLGIPVQIVDYYYFDGDTIIDGKTCKQMMCQHFTSPNYPYYDNLSQPNYLRYVGAWYEENQKVYFYDERKQSMVLKYDFSLGDYETLDFLNVDGYPPYIIGPKQTGGIKSFKGVYRDIVMCADEGQNIHSTFWLEGVGDINGPTRIPIDPILDDPVPEFLMSCVVGDEVIYFNDRYEDGATPAGARKNRFDFTHTTKIQPKTRISRGEEQSLYGEYNDQQLDINLDPLDEAYHVSITNESGQAIYEKNINAGNIVGLNIDISAYAKGRYTVTIENSSESFTGEFEAQTTGISDAVRLNDKEEMINDKHIYNLQGQRISTLQKGLNIVNGQKIFVK